jgi:hypothetical protein
LYDYLKKAPKSDLVISEWSKVPLYEQIIKGKNETASLIATLPLPEQEKI